MGLPGLAAQVCFLAPMEAAQKIKKVSDLGALCSGFGHPDSRSLIPLCLPPPPPIYSVLRQLLHPAVACCCCPHCMQNCHPNSHPTVPRPFFFFFYLFVLNDVPFFSFLQTGDVGNLPLLPCVAPFRLLLPPPSPSIIDHLFDNF